MRRHTLAERAFVARTGLALPFANIRYWSTVAPIVRAQLRHWNRRAQAIEDPDLRVLALEKLREEGFHAEAAAMLGTLAPRAQRRDVVRAIVALELLFDYLDGLTERPTPDPLADGERLFRPYLDCFEVSQDANRAAVDIPYLHELAATVTSTLERLPSTPAVLEVARASATRSAEAQIRMHAASVLGSDQPEQWARTETHNADVQWREFLCGAASSVLCLHALIVAAADPATTTAQAEQIDSAYLSICVLLTLLDGLVDHHQDSEGDHHLGYLSLYEAREELSKTLIATTRRAAAQTRSLSNGPHHAMLLVGVVAYYTSAPGADNDLAKPIAQQLRAELAPLILPTLALMRAWRAAKRLHSRLSAQLRGPASFIEKPRTTEERNET